MYAEQLQVWDHPKRIHDGHNIIISRRDIGPTICAFLRRLDLNKEGGLVSNILSTIYEVQYLEGFCNNNEKEREKGAWCCQGDQVDVDMHE